MIRVMYRWQVNDGGADTFAATWREITAIIRAHCSGARGSMLLQDQAKPGEYVGFALWESHDAWSRAGETVYPPEVLARRAELRALQAPVATLIDTQVFTLLEDLSG